MEMQGYSLKGAIPIFVEKESVVSRVKKSFHDKITPTGTRFFYFL